MLFSSCHEHKFGVEKRKTEITIFTYLCGEGDRCRVEWFFRKRYDWHADANIYIKIGTELMILTWKLKVKPLNHGLTLYKTNLGLVDNFQFLLALFSSSYWWGCFSWFEMSIGIIDVSKLKSINLFYLSRTNQNICNQTL